MRFALIACLMLLTSCLAVAGQAQEFRSGSARATLVELYTSEGCSSCPPADRWYSTLLDHPRLWQSVVPVAFHVDYWNHLGWEDRFSDPAYAARQRRYHEQGVAGGVYTPGVFAAGREWRRWRDAALKVPATGEVAGVLSLALEGGRVDAVFAPAKDSGEKLQLHVVLMGFGLETPVAAGENRGELLRHDFVVLGHTVLQENARNWSGKLPESALAADASRLALAAWVSPVDRQEPLQALGGWLRFPLDSAAATHQ
jgi:hypothetical protein